MSLPDQPYNPIPTRSTLPSPNPLSLTLPPTLDFPSSPEIHPTDFASNSSSDLDDHSDLSNPDPDPDHDPTSPTTLNYFVHNGYRYDGDIFQLRPPQERSIASRPERILEHKPPLLHNRQIFNRVYSEGTYSTRPSSLRQPNPNSNRYSASSFASSDDDLHVPTNTNNNNNLPVRLDAPSILAPPPLPVTRPASANCNLYGSLAYSQVPVTKISGHKPDLLSSSSANVATRRVWTETGKLAIPCVRSGAENVHPFVGEKRVKRGKSYSGAGRASAGTGGRHKKSLFRRGKLLSR